MHISVIIKTLNEEQNIAACIHSVLSQDRTIVGEIIVADSGSTDQTISIAQQFPVTIVQLQPPATAGCGAGAQLGYQYAKCAFICLLDGDMELAPDFLNKALLHLKKHPRLAGVTGHIYENDLSSLEYQRRSQRQLIENPVGNVDRMNGGGLYRRESVQTVIYLSDRNLHAYEELDLGLRLAQENWQLQRLDIPFVNHSGHKINVYSLLFNRWKNGYLLGSGEILRAAYSGAYVPQLLRSLPELKLWGMVYGWWLTIIVLMLSSWMNIYWLFAAGFCAVIPFVIMSLRKKSINMGIYSVVAWCFHAAAMPFGFFSRRVVPNRFVESKVLKRSGASAV